MNGESLREYPYLFIEIGEISLATKFTEKYISYMEDKIQNSTPSWVDYYNLTMYGYLVFREYDKAINTLQLAMKLNPENNDLHMSLGRAYDLNNNFDAALQEYIVYDSLYNESKTMQLASRVHVNQNIYNLFRRTGKFNEGIKYFKNRLGRGDDYIYFLGLIYLKLGDYEKAAHYFEKITFQKIQPSHALYYNFALAYYNISQFERSWEVAHKMPISEYKNLVDLIEQLKATDWYRSKVKDNQ